MYNKLIETIKERASSFGRSLQQPSSTASLAALRIRVQTELGVDLPEGYADFLTIVNGLDWNGLVIYATERSPIIGYSDLLVEGFVEGNLFFRNFEPMSDFLVFGEDGDVLYVLNISDKNYQVITTVGLTVLEVFATFDELLCNALEAHI